MQDTTNPVTSATTGIAVILRQLSASIGFLQYSVGAMDAAGMPTTVASYRHVSANLSQCCEKLRDLQFVLGGVAHAPGDFSAIELKNVGHVAGFVEFAVMRLGVLMAAMGLETLPPGTPGQKEFETEYARRVPIARAYGVAVDQLQQTHRLLTSDCHRLDLPEAARASNWRDARKRQLTAEIARINEELTEIAKYVEEAKAKVSKLLEELADVDQTTLFSSVAPAAFTEPSVS